jgi:hypothetical protein
MIHLNCRYLSILLLSTVGCSNSEKTKNLIHSAHDPFTKSFWDQNIKYMLTKTDSIIDTTTFDANGNMTKVQVLGYNRVWREFDGIHRVVRQLEKEEFPAHFVISYDTSDNYVIKQLELLSNMQWARDTSNTYVRNTYYVLYHLDELGRPLEEIDTYLDKTITYYTYDNARLIEKNLFTC